MTKIAFLISESEKSPSLLNPFNTHVPATPLWCSLDLGLRARPSQVTFKVLRGPEIQVNKNNTLFQKTLRAIKKRDLGNVTRE